MTTALRSAVRPGDPPPRVYAGLASLSAATLLLELALTRIFDVTLWSNLAFLVVSTAIFGFGLAGVVLVVSPAMRASRLESRAAYAFGIAVLVLAVILIWIPLDVRQLISRPLTEVALAFVLYVAVLAPFLASGLVIATLLTRYAAAVHRLYFWDLLGAGAGCLAIFSLPTLIGAERTLLAIAALGIASAALLSGATRRHVVLAAGVIAALASIGIATGDVEFHSLGGKRGVMLNVTRRPEYSRWDPVSKVDVIDEGVPFQKRILYDGGSQSSLFIKFDGNYDALRAHYFDIVHGEPRYNSGRYVALAHWLQQDRSPRTLVIGSAGGQETLAALAWGSRHVDAVEMVCAVIEAGRGPYAAYTGHLFQDARVSTHCDEGRSFLRHTTSSYDVIQIHSNHTTASIANGSGGADPINLQTVQAYREYFSHLAPDGILQINYFVYPRMITTAAAAWSQLFGDDFGRHLVITTGYDTMTTFLVKRSPWTSGEIARVRRFLGPDFPKDPRWDYQLIYAPGEPEQANIPAAFFTVPVSSALEARLPYRVEPPTDNRPFFRDLRESFRRLAPDRAGYVPATTAEFLNSSLRGWMPMERVHLYLLGGLSVLCSGIFILAPLLWMRRHNVRPRATVPTLVYFGALGSGFVIIELVLLFKCVLIVGHPIRSMATVLFTLLIGAGIGSRVSERLRHRSRRIAVLIAPVLCGLLALFIAVFPVMTSLALSLGEVERIALTALAILPLGVVLGMPFPLGIDALADASADLVPWAWGVNGFMTVVGSLVAIVASTRFGFNTTLMLAGLIYVAASAAYVALERSSRTGVPVTQASTPAASAARTRVSVP